MRAGSSHAGPKSANAKRILATPRDRRTGRGFTRASVGASLRRGLTETTVLHELLATGGETRHRGSVVNAADAPAFWEASPTVRGHEWERVAEFADAHAGVDLSCLPRAGFPIDACADLAKSTHPSAALVRGNTVGEALGCWRSVSFDFITTERDELLHKALLLGMFPPPDGCGIFSWIPLLEGVTCLWAAEASAAVTSNDPAGLLALSEPGAFARKPPATLISDAPRVGDAAVTAGARRFAAGRSWHALHTDASGLSAAAVMAPEAGACALEDYQRWRNVVDARDSLSAAQLTNISPITEQSLARPRRRPRAR